MTGRAATPRSLFTTIDPSETVRSAFARADLTVEILLARSLWAGSETGAGAGRGNYMEVMHSDYAAALRVGAARFHRMTGTLDQPACGQVAKIGHQQSVMRSNPAFRPHAESPARMPQG